MYILHGSRRSTTKAKLIVVNECYLLVFNDYIDNMVTSFKAPPLLTDESVYENWKREIEYGKLLQT